MTRLLDTQALDKLHAAMAAHVDRGAVPGLLTLVARVGDDGSEEVDVSAIGEAAFGSGVPLQRDTPFRITSMTKPIVAAAAMALVDEGLLDLDAPVDAPVDALLPELADRRVLKRLDGPLDETVPAERSITLRDLLTFRFGFGMVAEPTYNPPFPINVAADEAVLVMNAPEPRTPHTPDEWMRRFGALPLMEQPGARWRYNAGMLVTGVLLARAAKAPLEDVVRTRILEPLGMVHTGFVLPEEQARRLPTYYMSDFESHELRQQNVDTPETWTTPSPFPSAAAGLASTIDDYLAFARMLLAKGVHEGRRVLSEGSVAAMTANHLTPAQIAGAGFPLNGIGWGFGMSVTVEPEEEFATPGRYGWNGGFGTSWFNDPSRGLVAIFLSQNTDMLFNGVTAEFGDFASRAVA